MTAQDVARELGGALLTGGGYLARCPAHHDRNPSLSLTDRGGRLLVRCHAGCEQANVITALKDRGLWAEQPQRVVVATYTYSDEYGVPLNRVCRTEPKGFYQQRYVGGQWLNGLGNTRRVLYHLPEVIEAPIVFLAEGEKDCETLRAWGFVATTAAGGAKARWLSEYTDTLRGREVIIIPDNDAPGWERAAMLCRELYGAVARLRVYDLPETIKDISDWFAAGHSECELIAQLEGEYAV